MPVSRPALWEHVQRTFDEMWAHSEPVKIAGADARLFEGYTTEVYSRLGIKVPYYGAVNKILTEMGCVSIDRRGARGVTSRWILWKQPTLGDYEVALQRQKNDTQKKRARVDELAERVDKLLQSFGGINVSRALSRSIAGKQR